MKTLQLFNAVIAKDLGNTHPTIIAGGVVIEPKAEWAIREIEKHVKQSRLSGEDLNKTFHKSWETIKKSNRFELLRHQILHYLSTYGSNFGSEIYVPNEILQIPDLKLKFKVIKAYTKEEMTEKCLDLLRSGIALKEETIDDLMSVLVEDLKYSFTGDERIKNKEALIKLADNYSIYPKDPTEFLRYIIYRTTNQTLLIKNDALITEIKNSRYNPSVKFHEFGLEKLSSIFNRFKPLFLAYKHICPSTINKLGKLSKKHHQPLVSNPLNQVAQRKLLARDKKWLDNATPFALFKAISACRDRANGQDTFIYRVRNGKSFVKESKTKKVCESNFEYLINYLKNRFDLSEEKIFLPKDIEYALPTSEKMFVGNVPTGTKFTGKKLAAGVYWKNEWRARDLDLSGLNIGGKVGWNSSYSKNGLMYSGDITNAPNGAVEYMYAENGLDEPTLVLNNVYSGENDCDYKIVIGKGSKITQKYMMNPNKVFAEIKCQSIEKQMVIGMFIPNGDKQDFVLLNFGAGKARVSGSGQVTTMATKALYQQWSNPFRFRDLVELLGAEVVKKVENATVDLSIDNLEKDSFTKIFK